MLFTLLAFAGALAPTPVQTLAATPAQNAPAASAPAAATTSAPVALVKQEPEDEHPGTITEKIDKMHEDMCKEGRMDSDHCAKFREKLEEHHDELDEMHDEHKEHVAAEAAAEAPAPAAEVEASSAAVSTDSVTVESVVEHEPVITRQEFPYKEPCPKSATSAVAMLLLSFMFA